MRHLSIIALLLLVISTPIAANEDYYENYDVYDYNYSIDDEDKVDFSDPIRDSVIQRLYEERYEEEQRRVNSPIQSTSSSSSFSVIANSKIVGISITAAAIAGAYVVYRDAADDKKKHFAVGAVVGGVATTLARVYYNNVVKL